MNKLHIVLIFICLCSMHSIGCKKPDTITTKIAFGSCGHEDHPLSIFDVVVDHDPDLFIFLGDNIYGDTDDMSILQSKYNQLTSKSTYKNLKHNVPIIATWDDHDFGQNDAGRHYPYKSESKEIFLNVFDEPSDSDRRNREGIYTSSYYRHGSRTLQIILLDTRTFRDDILMYDGAFDEDKRYFYNLEYMPHITTDSTFLGQDQWEWLEKELSEPADIRIIGSSTQFGIEFNGYEAWANFPHEQKRFLELIKRKRASGVIFISGDVHYAEISKFHEEELYPIYDITSSGLSSKWHFATPNKNRIEGPIMHNHFGLITIEWNDENPKLTFEIFDVNDNQRIEYNINLSDIQF
ncbi:MAG: alkaline phosphatase D family protein [Saprospiraceae bacterium]